jgi:hypothetical protein
VGLERGLLSLVNTTEELLRTKSSGSSLETLIIKYDLDPWGRDVSCDVRNVFLSMNLALRSAASVVWWSEIMATDPEVRV